jgi:hypothetical protein
MAWPNKVYAATARLGIYYTDAFTGSGAQPTWGTINVGLATTAIWSFSLDTHEAEPQSRMFCVTAEGVYRRTTGNWALVLDSAPIVGADGETLKYLVVDKVTGYIDVTYANHGGGFGSFGFYRSIDHGDTWVGNVTIVGLRDYYYCVGSIDADNGLVVIPYVCSPMYHRTAYSTDHGGTWKTMVIGGLSAPLWLPARINPLLANRWYGGRFEHSQSWNLIRGDPVGEAYVEVYSAGPAAGYTQGGWWFDPANVDHMLTVTGTTTITARETTDAFATLDSSNALSVFHVTEIADASEDGFWVHGCRNPDSAEGRSTVYVSTNGYTLTDRSGTLWETPPHTGAIPHDCGGVIMRGLWVTFQVAAEGPTPPPGSTITPPGGTPIMLGGTAYVQAVTMPDYDGYDMGEPMPGDRGSFLDDTEAHARLHASDIRLNIDDGLPTLYHLPTGAVDGDVPMWSGVGYVPVDVPTQAELDLRTLDSLADVSTAGAEDGDTIVYNIGTGLWAPGSNVSHVHVFQEDASALCTGAETEFATVQPFLTATTMVWLNGLLQRPGAGNDYTEDVDFGGITFGVAPLAGDLLIIAYIVGVGGSPPVVEGTGPYTQLVGTENTYLVQLHCHTTGSDGNLSPSDLMTAYEAMGFDAVCITDHAVITADPGGHGMLYIPGTEVTAADGHMGSLFGTYFGTLGGQPGIAAIVAANGLAVLNHPNWSNSFTQAEMAGLTDYLGIEIHNNFVLTSPGFAVDDWDYLLTSVRRGIYGFSTDDYHSADIIERIGGGRVKVFAAALTLGAIKAALVAGDFVADVSNDAVTPGIPVITANDVTVICPGATAIRFIGDSGALLEEDTGDTGAYTFAGTEKYVRIEAVGDYTEAFGADVDWGVWQVSGGSWAVAGGTLTQATALTGPYYCILRRQLQGDQEILCDVLTPPSGTAEQAGILFNFTSTSLFYYLQLQPGEDARVWLNTSSILDTGTTAIANATWYRVRIKYTYATGQIQARVWLVGDGEPINYEIDVVDTTYRQGQVAFRCRYAASFDNLWINGFKTYYQPIPYGDWV